MAKLTLSDVVNLDNPASAVGTINANSAAIEVALEKTLSRDGTSPNQMGAPLDMNSNRILNLPAPTFDTDPVRLQELSTVVGGGTVSNIPAGGSVGGLLTKTSLTDYVSGWSNAITNCTISGLTVSTTTGTFTLTNTKTLTVSNTLTFSGTDSAAVNFAAGGTVAYVGTGLQQFASTTSAQLAGVISDETGSGLLVFNTSPSLTTPSLGVATATSINKVTITAPATSAVLTIANGKTLTANNTLTFAGTDGTTQTFQASDTIVGRATTDTLTNKTISGASNTLSNIGNGSLTNSSITIGSTSVSLGGTISAATGRGSSGLNIDQQTGHGDSSYSILATDRHVFTNANFTASRTWTLPAANAVNPGQRILIGDLQGTITATNTLIVAAAGADTINGLATLVLSSASTSVEVISDGVSKWYAVQSGSGGGGSGSLSPPKSYEFVATAAQTSFSGADQNSKTLTYTPGGIQVFLKGRRLNLADYTATTGAAVVLSLPANTGDLITIVDYGSGNASSFVAYEYTASAGQVTFTGTDANSRILTYSPGLVLVYVNGDLLSSGDYTATSGSSIVLGVARAVNDQIKIIAMNQSAVGMVPSNNLSDLTNTATARSNLFKSPTTQVFTSGSGTYTTPANCLWIEVETVGGGGGGAGSGTSPGAAGNGGNTTFGSSLLTANGGSAASTAAGGAGGTATGGYFNKTGAAGGNGSGLTNQWGGAGAGGPYGAGGIGGQPNLSGGGAAPANSGSGGGGGGCGATINSGGGGGSGGFLRAIINSPSATYAYAVGAAGTAGTAGTSGAIGGAGGSGLIIVKEYYI